MAKVDRVLSFFPAFFRTRNTTKLFREVISSLAAPLEEADSLLFRIQRAHRINVAEQATDIIRLAGILNLDPLHFEDILNDGSFTYDQKLELMRNRVRRVSRIHLSGLGTPWAVMEAAATFLNADIVPERIGAPLIQQEDDDGYSHKAMLEFATLPEKPREPIYLHEAPLRRQKVDPVERWPLDSWQVANQSPDDSPVRVVIRGVGERTVRPSVFCPGTQEGVVFNGIVPDGKTLILDAFEGAMLDKDPVDSWVIYFRGAIADFSREGQATFVLEDGRVAEPFNGGAVDTDDGAGPRWRGIKAPTGISEWRFKVAEAVYDGSDFDYCALSVPAEPIGAWDGDYKFDQSVFEYPPSGFTGMAWDERVACSFKLLLPPHLPQSKQTVDAAPPPGTQAAPLNPVARIGSIMPRFKAAGVQALVDAAKDSWILGSSVLRDPEATDGEGIAFHMTRLINPRTELFVP